MEPQAKSFVPRRFRSPAWTTAWALLAVLSAGCSRNEPASAPSKQFTGSTSCRQCHGKFYSLWSTSHHGVAMQPVTDTLVRQSLTPLKQPILIESNRFTVDLTTRHMRAEGPGGSKSYPMRHALGGKNVYYFLTHTHRGRLQVLPLGYDVQSNEWFNATASMVRHFGDTRDTPLDWTDSMLTFNTACYGCHVSQIAKNYDLKSDTYHTEWQEPGINCETCHGPGAEHIKTFLAAPSNSPPRDLKLIRMKTMPPPLRDDTCATCHAKMRPLTDTFTPGNRFFDHYDMVTLEDPDFHPDGRDLGENYTYTLWLTSPCVKAGKLDCIHCHTSSGRYRFAHDTANSACLPCHKDRVDHVSEHSHHKADSKGSQCIACHMPTTAFARMRRTDHSMRPPTPAATLAFNSPNACTLCHTDKDAAWADTKVKQWHPNDYQAPVLYRAGLIDAARKGDWRRLGDILAFIGDDKSDSIFVASLIRLLAACDDPSKWPVIRQALKHSAPVVRAAAAQTLIGDASQESIGDLLAATGDEYRLIRVSAAFTLARHADALANPTLGAAIKELEKRFTCYPDSWSSHYNKGIYCDARGRAGDALAAYEQAMALRPDTILPMVNASMLYAKQGNLNNAITLLKKALVIDPGNAGANFNLALALAEQTDMAGAEKHLRIALKTDPAMAQAAYNLGVILNTPAVCEEGIQWCRKAVQLRPGEPSYANALNFYLNTRKSKQP